MSEWIEQIEKQLAFAPTQIVATVLRVKGSVPREPGARMIITSERQWGTVGGGNLEYQTINIARSRLEANAAAPYTQLMPLGPALGQCCGGTVEILFEMITHANAPHRVFGGNAEFCGILRRAISGVERTEFELVVTGKPESAAFTIVSGGDSSNRDPASNDLEILEEQLSRRLPQVWVFGAGHVGTALVAQLSLLPCDVVWLDEREQYLNSGYGGVGPGGITTVVTDDVVGEICNAPADTSFIIMTHSHAVDYELCREILSGNSSFVGLIGSQTKRGNFEHRLKRRGFSESTIAKLRCPIGIDAIQSDQPSAIALGVAAQLVHHWESGFSSSN